jgi:pantoate--beta-alanine ligase
MEVIDTVQAMQAAALARRRAGERLVLVPTMGALHEGHVALVREALRRDGHLIVSIFVNPTQFGPSEDFGRYPRSMEADLGRLQTVASDTATVFAPPPSEMYPGTEHTWVEVEQLGDRLCGPFRPGHFRGVATVVAKLFNICQPDVVVMGLKDAQQFFVLRRMAIDLNFALDIVGVPTVREPDGLALSSRNAYLTPAQRQEAVVVSKAVFEARRRIEEGERRPADIIEAMQSILAQARGARVQYAEVVDTELLQPVERIGPGQEVLAAVAAMFGDTRLIDNIITRAPL